MDTVTGLVSSYGYTVLFLLVALESLGIPLPGETAVVTAAAFAALGRLSIEAVVATAVAAAIIGDNAGYWIGRKGGTALLRRFGGARLERARAFFDRHGAKAVFFGRFIALLRTWAAVLAGAAQMPYRTFMLYNALGALCWGAIVGALGFFFGRNLPRLEHYIGQATLAAALLVALVAALVISGRWFWRTRAAVVQRAGSSGAYLGRHLTIGLIVSALGLWLFAAITEDVISREPLTQFDVALLEWLHARATPAGYATFNAITQLGSGVTMWAVGLAVAVVLAVRRQRIVLIGWVAAFAGGGILNWVLKQAIQRPRPPYATAFIQDASWSFPSGHAMTSLIGYGMLAYVLVTLWVQRRSWQVSMVVAATLLVVTIGFSRLYLGVHYFSDVVGGYAAGVLWLSACISGVEVARRWTPSQPANGIL